MEIDEARDLALSSPVARLATVNPGLGVDVVPITFALVEGADGADRLVTAVDHKPKTTTALRRLRNVDTHPQVTVLVDHYDDDWERLWWVRIKGRGSVVGDGEAFDAAVDALVARYPQYREQRPQGPAILIDDLTWTGWRP